MFEKISILIHQKKKKGIQTEQNKGFEILSTDHANVKQNTDLLLNLRVIERHMDNPYAERK